MTHDFGAALWLVLLAHLIGDYLLQSDWMAREKLTRFDVAWLHGTIHALTFALALAAAGVVRTTWPLVGAALGVALTHALIDRYRLARHVCYAKEFLSPRASWPSYRLRDTRTGYGPDKPDWLAFWLLIVADNTLHLAINGAILWAVWP